MDLTARPVVLFDFDGTVVDSQPGILRIAEQVIRGRGLALPDRAAMLKMVGPPLEEGFALATGAAPDEARSMAVEYRERFLEQLTPADYPVMPGMRGLLDALRAQGRRLAVATSRMEDSARQMVAAQGLDQFEAVRGRVPGVRYSKAESISAALAALGAAPADAVMVGDRENDDAGAREAGVPCIGVYTGAAAPGEHEAAGAVAVARSVGELAALLGAA